MRLIDADALKKDIMSYKTMPEIRKAICEVIDNAPTVEYPFYQEAYQTGFEEGKNERPQGELANEVWKLYKKHQSHLATHVLEFGYELKELLGKYQKGGAE